MLGDDALPRGAGMKLIIDWKTNFQQQTQDVNFVRAPASSVYGRDNLVTTVRFEIRYQFSTADECRQWITRLGKLLGSRGNLDADYLYGGADRMLCAWGSVDFPTQIGVSAHGFYTFRGGSFQTNT